MESAEPADVRLLSLIGRRLLFGAGFIAAVGLLGEEAAAPVNPPVQGEVRLTLAAPSDYQVLQRRTASAGVVRVEGAWSVPRGSPPPEKLEARLIMAAEGSDTNRAWTDLPFDPRARGFMFELPGKAGGWYQLDVRVWRGGKVVSTLTVPHVGVGEVFVVAGQSNAANYGEVRQKSETGLVTAFDGERWALAQDPEPGATGKIGSFLPVFGDVMARKYHVPIGIVPLAVGSTSVREWLPRGDLMSEPPTTGAHTLAIDGGRFVSTGELFDRVSAAVRRWPGRGVRAVLWHQGESDWNQQSGHQISLAEYKTDLERLISASRASAGWSVPWFVAQVSYHNPEDPGSAEFRATQRSVADGADTLPGPDTDKLYDQYREKAGRGVHMNASGLRRHGELWAESVGAWLDSKLVEPGSAK